WSYGHYSWRPGYWTQMRPDWVWVPAYYVWTPHGYIYAGGYWDYPIVRRGILFAPVYFHPHFIHRVVFSFRPGFVIGLNVFSDNLFIRPKYRHYYFGNYYAPKYHKRGIYPWFSQHTRKNGHDPIYAHQRWKKRRNNRGWETNLHTNFKKRRDQENKRQPNIERGKKKNKHKSNNSIVKFKGKDRTFKHVENNKEKVFRAKELNKKKDYGKHNAPKIKRHQKEIYPKKIDKPSRKIVKRPKPTRVNPPRNSVADKKIKNHDRRAPSYRNHKAPRPEPETVTARNTSNKKYLKNKNYREVNKSQEPEIVEQNRKNTGQGSEYQGNHQINTKGKKAYGQGRYSRHSNRGRNEQWLLNGKGLNN
ncbi:MAG: hypothetical protein JRG81_07020, partial [Deltaproteobacteria bacterium]|nr:hypothetical protein [Deltaproteobacteria bacterium]